MNQLLAYLGHPPPGGGGPHSGDRGEPKKYHGKNHRKNQRLRRKGAGGGFAK